VTVGIEPCTKIPNALCSLAGNSQNSRLEAQSMVAWTARTDSQCHGGSDAPTEDFRATSSQQCLCWCGHEGIAESAVATKPPLLPPGLCYQNAVSNVVPTVGHGRPPPCESPPGLPRGVAAGANTSTFEPPPGLPAPDLWDCGAVESGRVGGTSDNNACISPWQSAAYSPALPFLEAAEAASGQALLAQLTPPEWARLAQMSEALASARRAAELAEYTLQQECAALVRRVSQKSFVEVD